MIRHLLSLTLCLLLSACAGYALVPPGAVEIDGKIKVRTERAWSWKAEQGGLIHWTRDGPALERLVFHAVADGKSLYPAIDEEAKQHFIDKLARTERDVVSLAFKATMTEGELMDLLAASFERADLRHVRTLKFSPASFAAHPGFRLEYEALGKEDEVRRRGLAAGAVIDGKLYVINYFGTALYHFDKTLPDVQAIIDSVEIIAKKG